MPIHNINDALVSYENSIKSGICTKPVPPYIEDNIESKSNEQQLLAGHYDTCFHLIKLYCDSGKSSSSSLENLLSPLSHTSNQMDMRLSWHLMHALIALNNFNNTNISISRHCLNSLNESYAAQLESIDDEMWHWSIFVLMHIEGDESRREACVRTYLSKHACSKSELNDKEKFLTDTLRVPEAWVYEAKALKAKYKHEYVSQFELLLKAHKWNEAHLILVEVLAPELFLKRNLYLFKGKLSNKVFQKNNFIDPCNNKC